ncbi:glycoside hydrolase family 95 protein [Paenibacillus sedimenti]|uniref:Glycoside hydrolase family 95 protein n=1 Tax=Paenibacillus sedimenti TaxID=2770274 RepID=A0A926QKK1_9BACL|nr:glycoside hydrolase family 95 protein [Paenibacillus sedimenti]MBD0381853.1 glycoside hydrolase family 95 protein [Paenibacillus sedimenti]
MTTLKLWYDKPADRWDEALPLGNGRLGAMVFGKMYSERIQLNEDSIWYGGPMDRNNPDALKHLPRIRELIFEGKVREAERLAAFALTGVPEGQRHYEPLGNLYMFFAGEEGEITEYKRELDLETGIAAVSYKRDGVRYRREIFASFPNQCLVIHLTADTPGSLTFHTQLARGNEPWNYDPFGKHKFKYQVGFNAYVDESRALSDLSTMMRGQCGGRDGVDFAGMMKVKAEGGHVSTIGNTVLVEGADSATLYLTAGTTFRTEDPLAYCTDKIEEAQRQPYERLRCRHIEDYRSLFDRVCFSLPYPDSLDGQPTDVRLRRVSAGERDDGLLTLYFQFGRYLMIAGSRPGSLPTTLQGIWNQDMLPIWDSKYTININTQMNYWPSETCNLAECHLPLFELLERMRAPGRRTAQVMYGCKGFMAHHNTDIWADTAPQDVCLSSTVWVLGAAWLCLHLWEHYEYGGDLEFLRQAYDTMKEAAEFLADYMVEDWEGRLVICPTLSPENEYRLPSGETGVLCSGASMDSQIIRALFESCIAASGKLGIDSGFATQLRYLLEKIPQPQIGRYGQIQEWADDYEEVEPGHRHISQLFALHPGNQITVRETPELALAARRTLERRLSHGGGHTGWSRAWIANMWARLEDGQLAYENVGAMLGHSTLPNLFCTHPPFQIDGNFGGTSAIAQMLIQSHRGEIHLLPAIPECWQTGGFSGMRARGGVEIDCSWEAGAVVAVKVKAALDQVIQLRVKNFVRELRVTKGTAYHLDGQLNLLIR